MILSLLAALAVVAGGASKCHAIDLSGCWSGQWVSCKNGHHGPMTATLCKLDDKHYSAHFRGRFWRIFPFRYNAVLTVTSDDGKTVKMGGSRWLGRMFGTFSYNATVTETCFDANFSACRDWGKFEMTRCTAPCKSQ
jgi:hypothetical protein